MSENRRRWRTVVAVTGSPATGKSRFAMAVVRASSGASLIEINDVVRKKSLFSSKDKEGAMIVKLNPLTKEIKREIAKREGLVLVVGHLAPELGLRYDMAIVLRGKLKVLAGRLKKRGYSKEKIRENLVSEALDYCGIRMAGICTRTYEIGTEGELRKAEEMLCAAAEGRRAQMRKREINSMKELLSLINSGWRI
ncbi:MAG: AAA family ATPase [Candidatus Marsarchaeota archaeon]|nr:AAA family ATPase [Candidatus Marsarchaeota archaeon]